MTTVDDPHTVAVERLIDLALFTERITGPALSVLHTVLHTWPPPT